MKKLEIAPIVVGKLLNIGGLLRKKADQMLQPYNLNQQQFSILFTIGHEEPVNQKDMVTKMVLEKAHVSKIVKKLSNLGLIRIAPNEQDGRSSWLTLTSKGRDVLQECHRLMTSWNEEWTSEMKSDQLSQLLDSLAHLQEILREGT